MEDSQQHPAFVLFREVEINHPDVYQDMINLIKPHGIQSLIRIFKEHLDHSGIDLQIFNNHRSKIPNFLLQFVKCILKNIPSPGDAFGIQLTCKITKNNTQNTLDSRHLKDKSFNKNVSRENNLNFINRALKYELELYSLQSQILEIAGRRKYSSIFVRGYSIRDLLSIFPYESCVLPEGGDTCFGFDLQRNLIDLKFIRFILVPSSSSCSSGFLDDKNKIIRIVYYSYARDLIYLLKHLDSDKIFAFNDVKYVFQKCGVACYFFNMVRVVRITNASKINNVYDSQHLHDLINVIKYQCRTGTPLPLNRDGLAKNPERSPLEVLSFEAPKKNYVRLSTEGNNKHNYPVKTSTDKMFFGQQFNEGTGYSFAVLPRTE